MKINKTHFFFLALTIIFSLSSCFPIGNQVTSRTPIPHISHVVNNVVSIEPIWVVEKIDVSLNDQDVSLDSFAGKTCFLGDIGIRYPHKNLDKNLVCLESQNGNLLWINESGVHDSIVVTSKGIFVTYISSLSVRKYDSQNGNLIWRKSLGGNGSDYLYFQDDQIEILDRAEKTWILDSDGKVVRIVDGKVCLSHNAMKSLLIRMDFNLTRQTQAMRYGNMRM